MELSCIKQEQGFEIFENEQFGQIRVVMRDGEPWFVAKDVCAAFGDTNHSRSVGRIDAEDKTTFEIVDSLGRHQRASIVNESGLYALLFAMQPQKANNDGVSDAYPIEVQKRIENLRKFKRWVTHEVIPSIRKHGIDPLTIGHPPELTNQVLPAVTPVTVCNNVHQTVCGVECYEENGTAYLKLETVARGLGFTRIAASGNEVVRWERVDGYLAELNFVPTSGHESFIPENIFYRLAMKAKNEVAEKFQALVADEIIPSIRKHGMYATPVTVEAMLADPDFAITLLTNLKQERAARVAAESQNQIMQPKANYYDKIVEHDVNLGLRQFIKECGLKQKKFIDYLLDNKYLYRDKRGTLIPYAEYIDKLFVVKEYVADNGYGGIQTLITPEGRNYFLNKINIKAVLGC